MPRTLRLLFFRMAFAASSVFASATAIAQTPRVLTLKEVERSAMSRQPQIVAARAATAAAEARADQAAAPLLPQIAAIAQYTRQTGNFVPRPGALPSITAAPLSRSLTRTFNFFNFGATVNQLVYDFGQTTGRHRAAQATADAQRDFERSTRLQVMLIARVVYFNAYAQKALVEVARETLVNQDRHFVQVRGFVGVGTRPEIDLAQAKTAVANARVQLIQAENAYETAKAQLNQAAGLIISTSYDVGDEQLPAIEGEDQALDILVARAAALRPDVAQLQDQRRAQVFTVGAVRGAYWPTLSAVGSATEAGTSFDGLVPNWAVGAQISWWIFQGGLTKAAVREASANLDIIDAQQALLLLQVRLGVDTARLAVRAAKSSIVAAMDALASALDQLRLAEGRYATGVGSIIELGDAQVAATTAAAQLVMAQYGLSSARAQLLAALGRE